MSIGSKDFTCSVGDFDGDMNLDLLISVPNGAHEYTSKVYLLQMKHLEDTQAVLKKIIDLESIVFIDEPMVFAQLSTTEQLHRSSIWMPMGMTMLSAIVLVASSFVDWVTKPHLSTSARTTSSISTARMPLSPMS